MLKPISTTEVNRMISTYCHNGWASMTALGANAPIFDEAGALEFASGNRTVLTEMITLYIKGTEKNIDMIALHLESCDMQKAKSAAHLIKGESKAMGVRKVFSTAAKIEEAAKAGDREKCLSLTLELRSNFTEFNESLNSAKNIPE
jgi:HPt (histidine-containing phosphotransfer) domain-containing protein